MARYCGFLCLTDQQPDQQTRHHRHSKIHQACYIPRAWIKTAPPRHIHTLAMPEHFNPAIFCLGVFTRNEERTTGYRPVSPVSGKKANQYLCSHSTKCMKERGYIHYSSFIRYRFGKLITTLILTQVHQLFQSVSGYGESVEQPDVRTLHLRQQGHCWK